MTMTSTKASLHPGYHRVRQDIDVLHPRNPLRPPPFDFLGTHKTGRVLGPNEYYCSFLTWLGHDFSAWQLLSVHSLLIATTTCYYGFLIPVVLCQAFCMWHWPICKNWDLSFICGHHHLHSMDARSTSRLLHYFAAQCWRAPPQRGWGYCAKAGFSDLSGNISMLAILWVCYLLSNG